MRLHALATSVLTTLATCAYALEPNIKMDTERISEESAVAAIAEFRNACAPLFTTHAPDVAGMTATAEDGWTRRAAGFGWGAEITIVAQLKGKVATFAPGSGADGQKLYYYIGGGNRPGFQAQKQISLKACGRDTYDDAREEFVALGALANHLPASPAPSNSNVASLNADVEQAWKGDYQSQRNVAWCYYTGCDGARKVNVMLACAWRIVIVNSGHRGTDVTDYSNRDLECSVAEAAGLLKAARARAVDISRRIAAQRRRSR